MNSACYVGIFSVENVIRELCVERMSSTFGERWYFSQLTPTAKSKYMEGLKYDRSQFSLTFTSFHPIYYLDFPDLRELLSRKDNWKLSFSSIFSEKDYEKLKSVLSELEPIRNKVAHNRVVSIQETKLTEDAVNRLLNWIGREQFHTYLTRSNSYGPIFGNFALLQGEIAAIAGRLASFELAPEAREWNNCSARWWWDASYLGFDLDPIEAFYALASEYRALKRGRGQGLDVEAWVNTHPIAEAATAAMQVCGELIARGSREA